MIKQEKINKIEEFLSQLGDVKKTSEDTGFYILCKKCGSQNVESFDDSGCGSVYTGCWSSAGLKCLDCGNAATITR